MYEIERCNGRISAFKEVQSLITMITTADVYTKRQLEILQNHIDDQMKLDEHFINSELELMEGRELLGGVNNGGTL